MAKTTQPKPNATGCGCFTILVAAVIAFILIAIAGGSSSPRWTVTDATSFFRQSTGQHYHGHTMTNDGRGCAKVTAKRFVCTGYVRTAHEQGIDVYGIITIHPQGMKLSAHIAQGREIQNWFTNTGGGCQTASCKGAVLRKPYHGAVTIGNLTIPAKS